MANSFKSDESFLRKLVVGAAGTNATMDRLAALGFTPIELERGSRSYKIWKQIKIKRVRVPDILCLSTGLRFESRGKTKLEISMSHSLKDPKRAWDVGMRDDDYVSIVAFWQDDQEPVQVRQVSPVHFISVGDLRRAYADKRVSTTKPKGVEEASEIRVIWPSALAKFSSRVRSVDANHIVLEAEPKMQRVELRRKAARLQPQVGAGDEVQGNQIVAAAVPVHTTLSPPPEVDETYYIAKLQSVNMSERYAAAKALRYRGYYFATPALVARMEDSEEGIYVQLEAAAALAAHDDVRGWQLIEMKLRGSTLDVPLEPQLETVIVASEIRKKHSQDLIIEVLRDPSRHEELRAGAAWALGQLPSAEATTALVETFNQSSLVIRTEAARALLLMAEEQTSYLVEQLRTGDPFSRDGISWVLARKGSFNVIDLVYRADVNLRRWVSYIVGLGVHRIPPEDIEALSQEDPQVYFAASVLWQILASWIDDLKEF